MADEKHPVLSLGTTCCSILCKIKSDIFLDYGFWTFLGVKGNYFSSGKNYLTSLSKTADAFRRPSVLIDSTGNGMKQHEMAHSAVIPITLTPLWGDSFHFILVHASSLWCSAIPLNAILTFNPKLMI